MFRKNVHTKSNENQGKKTTIRKANCMSVYNMSQTNLATSLLIFMMPLLKYTTNFEQEKERNNLLISTLGWQ